MKEQLKKHNVLIIVFSYMSIVHFIKDGLAAGFYFLALFAFALCVFIMFEEYGEKRGRKTRKMLFYYSLLYIGLVGLIFIAS